jgi:hypothetical protein
VTASPLGEGDTAVLRADRTAPPASPSGDRVEDR